MLEQSIESKKGWAMLQESTTDKNKYISKKGEDGSLAFLGAYGARPACLSIRLAWCFYTEATYVSEITLGEGPVWEAKRGMEERVIPPLLLFRLSLLIFFPVETVPKVKSFREESGLCPFNAASQIRSSVAPDLGRRIVKNMKKEKDKGEAGG